MNDIIKIELIINNEIDRNNYIETLLLSSLKYKIISRDQYESIILKLLNLLSIKISKYTKELTSSVPINIAKNINDTDTYIISLGLDKDNVLNNIRILLNEDINKLSYMGYERIKELIRRTKFFYELSFLNNIIDIDNYFYNSTLRDGIRAFFKRYNYEYDAIDNIITADYDPYLERPKLLGIEFIKKYLEYINYENIFCKKFAIDKIKILLSKIYSNYQELPINIFENILTITIILEYLEKDIYSLNILDRDIDKLYNDFLLDNNKYFNNLKESYINVIHKINIQKDAIKYIDKCSYRIINKIFIYTKKNNLSILCGNNYIEQEI